MKTIKKFLKVIRFIYDVGGRKFPYDPAHMSHMKEPDAEAVQQIEEGVARHDISIVAAL